jgi:hypothetical protein
MFWFSQQTNNILVYLALIARWDSYGRSCFNIIACIHSEGISSVPSALSRKTIIFSF